jgi:hypothetical protein
LNEVSLIIRQLFVLPDPEHTSAARLRRRSTSATRERANVYWLERLTRRGNFIQRTATTSIATTGAEIELRHCVPEKSPKRGALLACLFDKWVPKTIFAAPRSSSPKRGASYGNRKAA